MKGLFGILFFCIGVMVMPAKALATDPPTCQLNNKFGEVHQTVCHGETVTIKAISTEENAPVQWFRQNNTGGWTAITDATNTELTTGQGIYKAIFTFSDSSTCETENDTIEYWKPYKVNWEVTACRAQIASILPIPFPVQSNGNQEMATPINLNSNDEITYNWQVIPEPVQASFTTSSSSIYPLTDGFFQDTTLGLHKVILTVSQQGSVCMSRDTMEVTLLPLNVWADTIISYGGQPAIAVAHASGGTEPYQFTWSSADSCLIGNCDSALIIPGAYNYFSVSDIHSCSATRTFGVGHLARKSKGWTNLFNLPNLPAIVTKANLSGTSIFPNRPISVDGQILVDDSLPVPFVQNAAFIVSQMEEKINQFTAQNQNSSYQLRKDTIASLSGVYFHYGYLNLSDSIVLVGSDSSLFLIHVMGDFNLNSSARLILSGIESDQVFWMVHGKIRFSGVRGSWGYLLSEDSIFVLDSISITGTLMAKKSIHISCGSKEVEVKHLSPGMNALQAIDDPCPIQMGANLACNPEFDSPSADGPADDPNFGSNRLDRLVRWFPKQVNSNLNSISTTDVFFKGDCEGGINSCYRIPLNLYSTNASFPGGNGCPENDWDKCHFVGISSYWQNENLMQRFRPNQNIRPGTNYLFRVRAAQANRAKYYPKHLRFLFSYDGDDWPSTMYGVNVLTPELNTTNTFKYYCGIAKTAANEAPIEFGLMGDEGGIAELRTDQNGRDQDWSYTFIDRFDLFEAPSFRENILVCQGITNYQLLKNPEFSIPALYAETGATLQVLNQNNGIETISNFNQFQIPQNVTQLTYQLLVNGYTLNLGSTNFIPSNNSFTIHVNDDCPNAIRLEIIPAVENAQYSWIIDGSTVLTTVPFIEIGQGISHSFSATCSIQIGTCTYSCAIQLPGFQPYQIQLPSNLEFCAGFHSNIPIQNFNPDFAYYFRVDNGAWQLTSSPTINVLFPFTLSGNHTLQVKAISGPCVFVNSFPINIINFGEYKLTINPDQFYCRGSGGIQASLLRTGGGNPPPGTQIIWIVNNYVLETNGSNNFHCEEIYFPPTGSFNIRAQLIFQGCTTIVRKDIINQSQNNLTGGAAFAYEVLGSPEGEVIVAEGSADVPITVCPGMRLTLLGFSIQGGNFSTEFQWAGPGISGWQAGLVTVNLGALPPGVYTYHVRAKTVQNCFSESRNLIVTIPNDFNQTIVVPDCDLLTLQNHEGLFYNLTQPNGQTTVGDNFQITPTMTEGRYLLSLPSNDQGCVNGEFTVYGGFGGPEAYLNNLTFAHTSFVLKDIQLGGTGVTPIFQIPENAHMYVWGVPEIDASFAGGTVSGSALKVKAGAQLQIGLSAKIEGICNNMWKGIELEVPSSGTQFVSLIIDGAEIRDAYKAVLTSSGSSTSEETKPFIDIRNTSFSNCYYGLDICAPKSTGSFITGNAFQSVYSEMKAPFDFLRNKQFVRTGKTVTDGLFLTHTGIRINEPFNLTDNQFKSNKFNGMAFGIALDFSLSGSLPSFTSQIKDNTEFKDCHLAAIYLKGCGKLKAENNPIVLPDDNGLKFKSSFQMDYLGKTILDNPPFVVDEIGPYYTYGIYHDDACEVSGRSLEVVNNPISSPATSGIKFHVGIGLRSDGGANVSILRNGFDKLDIGIRPVYHPGNYTFAINGNRFTDNTTAISLSRFSSSGTAALNFTLKCNQFKLSCAEASSTACNNEPERTGLLIGEGVVVNTQDGLGFNNNAIGGTNAFNTSGDAYPNANDWPVQYGTIRGIFPTSNTTGDIQQDGWERPAHWLALENHTANPTITYFRYKNEFVWNWDDENSQFLTSPTTTRVITDGTTPDPLVAYEDACAGFITTTDPIFPARISVVPDSTQTLAAIGKVPLAEAWLGDASPNPAGGRTMVECIIPASEEMAILQFVDMGSGKVLSGKTITERGRLRIEIDLGHFPSGTYGYQVILQKAKLGAKRFVVVK